MCVFENGCDVHLSSLWIANDVCVNVQKPDLTFHRMGGREGLPVSNITSVATDGVNVWLGSEFGLVLFSENRFQFLASARFLVSTVANSPVRFVSSLSTGVAVVATNVGYSIVSIEDLLLDEKAKHFESMLYDRHRFTSSPQTSPRQVWCPVMPWFCLFHEQLFCKELVG